MKFKPLLVTVIFVAGLSIVLTKSCSYVGTLQSDNAALRSDNAQQGQIIATQAFNFNRFNQVAEYTNRLNSLIDASAEETVIEYREILRREKTCDLPVPADVAGGLLEYAYRLRAGVMLADPGRPAATNARAAAASSMTYCQAVLWIRPLLAVIEKGNNNFAGIREIEETRASQ